MAEEEDNYEKARLRNPKAFALQSYVAAERQFRRTQDIKAKRLQVPEVDRAPQEPPPIFVALVGPSKVGKSLLMKALIKNYTKQRINNIKGPVTVVTGKNRRITFYECNNDINSMIDTAKVADLVLLMIDASFGFEMETFEFLNICQVHGFPRIMGVLTHMDLITNNKQLKKTKKKLKHRFWTEIYDGAKLFYLTGLFNQEYRKNEVHNLARFISVMKFKEMGYRSNHSFLVADRMEDITHPEQIRKNEKCDRNICLYGYVRGCPLKPESNIHIPGCGDFLINDITFLPDPCPLPSQEKKRHLNDTERLVYAPFSGVGGIVYDKDAVYIELGGSHSHHKKNRDSDMQQQIGYSSNNAYLNTIIGNQNTIDTKLNAGKLKLFTDDKEGLSGDDEEDESQEDEDEEMSENEEDEESEDDEEEEENESEEGDEESGSQDSEDSESNFLLKSKSNIKLRAAQMFEKNRNKHQNWSKLVYGNDQGENQSVPDLGSLGNEEDEDFFTVKKPKDEPIKSDNSKYMTSLNDWTIKKDKNGEKDVGPAFDSIKDCFVTGQWDKSQDAETRLREDEELGNGDDDEELLGDFEDYETGEVHRAADNKAEDEDEANGGRVVDNNDRNRRKPKSELTKRERLLEKKRRIKEMFDKEFDETKGGGDVTESVYYDFLKQEASKQSELNRLEFEKMDDEQRVKYEGFKPGMYVRVEIKSMPVEFLANFDATDLVILGSLDLNESNIGLIQVRLKKHRWHDKILKNGDPLMISLGWRRFQTVPIFYIQDHNMRNRFLKYTPQHMHCHACFWGPITAQNTGFLSIQTLSNETKGFRISSTGVVVDSDKSVNVVKKLKIIGTPIKIFRKTAFINGMFSSNIEAAKFIGAKVKTVSGIRGQIKKALSTTTQPNGSVRITFEDKILMSDVVFLRSWFGVDVPKFYTPVTNLLLSHEQGRSWSGLKRLGELKKENSIKINPNENSIYKPIEREEKVFAPLKIRDKIEEQLPFRFKNKDHAKVSDPVQKQRVAVMREPHEEKMANVVKMFKKVYENKMKKKQEQHLKQVQKHKKDTQKVELKRLQKSKEMKKQIYRRLGKQEKRKSGHSDE